MFKPCCQIAPRHKIKDVKENNWSHDTNVQCRTVRYHTVAAMFLITTYRKFSNKRTGCYDKPSRIHPSCRGHSLQQHVLSPMSGNGGGAFIGELRYFLHKPIVYGVMCLLYGVALLDSVQKMPLILSGLLRLMGNGD